MFEIVLAQYRFTKRTWWCMSSLVQQVSPPDFTVKLQLHVSDPFMELNRRLITTFEDRLNLVVVPWEDQRFFRRGYTRNLDLQQSRADWLLFLDPDSVLHPAFLQELACRPLDSQVVNGATRTTMTDFFIGYKLVDAEEYQDLPIEDAAAKCAAVKCLRRGRRGGIGFCQLLCPKAMRSRGLIYAQPDVDRRYDDSRGYATPSDRYLRQIVGCKTWFDLPPLYHLQHWRRSQPDCPDHFKEVCH